MKDGDHQRARVHPPPKRPANPADRTANRSSQDVIPPQLLMRMDAAWPVERVLKFEPELEHMLRTQLDVGDVDGYHATIAKVDADLTAAEERNADEAHQEESLANLKLIGACITLVAAAIAAAAKIVYVFLFPPKL